MESSTVTAPTAIDRTPTWVHDAVFYQIFPDRFAKSDAVPKPANLEPWDSPPTERGFKGGDLVGVGSTSITCKIWASPQSTSVPCFDRLRTIGTTRMTTTSWIRFSVATKHSARC